MISHYQESFIENAAGKSRSRSRSTSIRLLGVTVLGSGAALLVHIVAHLSLRLALLIAIGLMVSATGLIVRQMLVQDRSILRHRVQVGLLAGAMATCTYDVVRFVASQLIPSPYQPFEVIQVFGKVLAGSSSAPVFVYGAGFAFHILNGLSFGVAFCLLFRYHGALRGIAWGLLLEIVQLTFYPGFLHIQFYQEFVQISALSHFAFGIVLGISSKHLLATHHDGSIAT